MLFSPFPTYADVGISVPAIADTQYSEIVQPLEEFFPKPDSPKIEIVKSRYQEELEAQERRDKEAREKAEQEAREAEKKRVEKAAQVRAQVTRSSVAPPQKSSGSYDRKTLCSCVLFAIARTGMNPGSIGYAKNWPINSKTPKVGAVVVTSESSGYGVYTGHVAVVTAVTETHIVLDEANYDSCHRTTGRTLPIDSLLIRGYSVL